MYRAIVVALVSGVVVAAGTGSPEGLRYDDSLTYDLL
jgi:hypothetical protein